jgi:hypothetical protein
MELLTSAARKIAGLPRRLLAAVGWIYTSPEPTGLGLGHVHMGDLDETEDERRHEREMLRRPEEPPADST